MASGTSDRPHDAVMNFPRLIACTGQPRLRFDLNIGGLFGLPAHSTVPRGSAEEVYRAAMAAGLEGFQCDKPGLCREIGAAATHWGRVDQPAEADELGRRLAAEGYQCASVHVGTEYHDDLPALRLLDACITASVRHGVPLFVETHRATVTQDPWRTLGFVRALPELRFNGDLSHWYTGTEFHYGDVDAKLRHLQPVLERVRFIHARIGTPGCIQVDVGDGQGRPHVEHFRRLWGSVFAAFQRQALPGEVLPFTPELLGPPDYARTFPDADGQPREEGDRWQQAFVLWRIAQEEWTKIGSLKSSPEASR
jgi:hypothetical protein